VTRNNSITGPCALFQRFTAPPWAPDPLPHVAGEASRRLLGKTHHAILAGTQDQSLGALVILAAFNSCASHAVSLTDAEYGYAYPAADVIGPYCDDGVRLER
jgi:hypothetical protein